MRGLVIRATGWTLEEFDRQPFPLVLEILESLADDPPARWVLQSVHGVKSRRRKRKMTDVELAKIHSAVGTQTVQDERLLPPWVQEARKQERERRVKAGKK